MASDSMLGACWPLQASFLPIGALLDALGAEKKKLGTALGRLGAEKGAKMGPKRTLRTPLFEVPSWGPKLDPPFYGFPSGFLSFPMAF